MLFEGTEKKFELQLTRDARSLRALGRGTWTEIVRRARADVLSLVSNDVCDAYLLSESSLFVFDRRAVMITCGRTRLVDAVKRILETVELGEVASFIYERKNENFPHLQDSTFDEDAETLGTMMPGVTIRFGEQDGHHLSLFHLDRPYLPPAGDITAEILMYELPAPVRDRFASGSRADLGELASAAAPDSRVDEHFFEPAGYSLNAIRGDEYTTVHVTPDHPGSYASLETNRSLDADALGRTVDATLRIFRPRRADLVLFQTGDGPDLTGDYRRKDREVRRLGCGYRVEFSHFERMSAPEPAPSPGSQR